MAAALPPSDDDWRHTAADHWDPQQGSGGLPPWRRRLSPLPAGYRFGGSGGGWRKFASVQQQRQADRRRSAGYCGSPGTDVFRPAAYGGGSVGSRNPREHHRSRKPGSSGSPGAGRRRRLRSPAAAGNRLLRKKVEALVWDAVSKYLDARSDEGQPPMNEDEVRGVLRTACASRLERILASGECDWCPSVVEAFSAFTASLDKLVVERQRGLPGPASRGPPLAARPPRVAEGPPLAASPSASTLGSGGSSAPPVPGSPPASPPGSPGGQQPGVRRVGGGYLRTRSAPTRPPAPAACMPDDLATGLLQTLDALRGFMRGACQPSSASADARDTPRFCRGGTPEVDAPTAKHDDHELNTTQLPAAFGGLSDSATFTVALPKPPLAASRFKAAALAATSDPFMLPGSSLTAVPAASPAPTLPPELTPPQLLQEVSSRTRQIRASASLGLLTDAVQTRVWLQRFLASRAYLEAPGHPLNIWIVRCRDSLERGAVQEARDNLNRVEAEVALDDCRLTAAFAKFDHDISGVMEIEELRHFATYIGLGPEIAETLMKELDTTGSGAVGFDEFAHWVRRSGGIHSVFQRRRKGLHEGHHGIMPGSRVRARFRTNGVRSRTVWDARVVALLIDGATARLDFSLGRWSMTQDVPLDWIEQDTDLVEALQAVGIMDDAQHYWAILLPHSEQAVVKSLKVCQQNALSHVRDMATVSHTEALAALVAKCEVQGYPLEKLWAALTWIRDMAPVIIHLDLDRVGESLEADTFYRNQFETHTSGGILNYPRRIGWERDLFGGAYDGAEGHERPKYGVLDVMNDYRGVLNCQHYGRSYLVLKNARLRCTFAPEDSAGLCASQLAVVDQYAHVLLEFSDTELHEIMRVASAPEGSAERIGDSERLECCHYTEAQIHGAIDLGKHVERLVVHEDHRRDGVFGEDRIRNLCDKHGWEFVWMGDERLRRIREERDRYRDHDVEVSWLDGEVVSSTEVPDVDRHDVELVLDDCIARRAFA